MELPPPIPLGAVFNDAGFGEGLPRLREADAILGVDLVSREQFIIFGRKALRRLVRGGAGRGARVLRIALRLDSEELPHLLALVMVYKGRHDYEPEGGQARGRSLFPGGASAGVDLPGSSSSQGVNSSNLSSFPLIQGVSS